MMKRVLCIWLPNWSLQRVRSERPELKGRPLVLYTGSTRGSCQVVACTHRAAEQGITPGMPLAEARTLLERRMSPSVAGDRRRACYERQEPSADRTALRKLAVWCQQFSPLAGVEDAEFPETLILDATGCAPLFGGERALAEGVLRALRDRGLWGRVALADTIGAAWACAHHEPTDRDPRTSPNVVLIPRDQQAAALKPLPVEALRLSANTVKMLYELDLRSVGQLEALPRAELPSRFGAQVIRRLDQALGRQEELIVPEKPSEPIQAAWSYESPVSDRRAIERVLQELIGRILGQLAPRHEGVQQLFCRLKGAQDELACFSIGLVHGSDSSGHLLEMLWGQLERVRLTGDVSEVCLLAGTTVPLESRQEELFNGGADADAARELALLIDRLSNRLGRQSVLCAWERPDAQPEYAVDYEPWVGAHGRPFGKETFRTETVLPGCGEAACFRLARPLLLKFQPAAVAVMSVVPDGPPIRLYWKGHDHSVARSWGPERIETGWWRNGPIRRDYYRVETASGHRFWLFRSLEQGNWFLQGEFG